MFECTCMFICVCHFFMEVRKYTPNTAIQWSMGWICSKSKTVNNVTIFIWALDKSEWEVKN